MLWKRALAKSDADILKLAGGSLTLALSFLSAGFQVGQQIANSKLTIT